MKRSGMVFKVAVVLLLLVGFVLGLSTPSLAQDPSQYGTTSPDIDSVEWVVTVDGSALTSQDITPLPNGGFEDNPPFTAWTVVDQAGGSGSWFVQSGTTSPSGCLAGCNPVPVPAPSEGAQAAMSAQDGPGSHLLYQDFVVPNASVVLLNFDLYLLNRAATEGWVTIPTLDYAGASNQQVRVDIMDPLAPVDDVGAGVLLNVYQTNPGDPLDSAVYIPISVDISAFAGQSVRLRFAEVDNLLWLNAGVDNVFVETATAITLASFEVGANDGQAKVTWETATEIDNAGFNLYRASSTDGPWTQVNTGLISAKGDPVSGAQYTFTDRPGRGTFYYRLEDVDFFGLSTVHEPSLVEMGAPIRIPWFRPSLPPF